MFNYYKLDVLPIILNRFKVKDIIQCGVLDNVTFKHISNYCEANNCSHITINSRNVFEFDITDYSLNVLPNFRDYGAIFLNDDPNWYTVFNELDMIKNNNEEFPLVFICHNIFPNKRRDSYINPNIIPEEFRNEFSDNLFYNNFNIYDGFFHAIDDNTSKNGVLTAIEDFLETNYSVGMMKIKLQNGITILYPKNSISEIRLGLLFDEINEFSLEYEDVSDNIIKNQLLTNYISKFSESNEKNNTDQFSSSKFAEQNKIIKNYENELDLKESELKLKNSQINSIDEELTLKDLQIKNFESKLINRENDICELNAELKLAKNNILSLKKEIDKKDSDFKNMEIDFNNKVNSLNMEISKKETSSHELNLELNNLRDEIFKVNEELNKNNDIISIKDNQIKAKQDELIANNSRLNYFSQQYNYQLSKLDEKKYCISCYKNEIENKHVEIQYLKKNSFYKKLLSPISYLYLVFKSNPKELFLNFKLFKALKDSQCFDIGFYLNNNKDILESKWSKYFSPELHYVCNGFYEKRKFNKKYFNRNSKEELLEYILNCK